MRSAEAPAFVSRLTGGGYPHASAARVPVNLREPRRNRWHLSGGDAGPAKRGVHPQGWTDAPMNGGRNRSMGAFTKPFGSVATGSERCENHVLHQLLDPRQNFSPGFNRHSGGCLSVETVALTMGRRQRASALLAPFTFSFFVLALPSSFGLCGLGGLRGSGGERSMRLASSSRRRSASSLGSLS